jgi:hypothetical protein
MHPWAVQNLAEQHIDDLLREAARRRTAMIRAPARRGGERRLPRLRLRRAPAH